MGSLTCSIRILILPVSDNGEVTSLLACHTSISSSPSSHSIQCSAFACCIFSVYQFHCWWCSLWMGWFGFTQWCLPYLPVAAFVSSPQGDHHHFEYGIGFDSSMFLLMMSYIASFSALSFLSKLWMLGISVGGGRLARFSFKVFTSSVQFTCLKFCLGVILILGAQMSICVTMG